MWQAMWPMEELKIDDYVFEISNPYIDNPDVQAIAESAIERGNIFESILALEAIVLRNPETPDA